MLFNSFSFLIFFPVVTVIYYLLPHKYRWLHLLIASCIFYCAFIPIYILILFFTIIIDYLAGIYIEQSVGRNKKKFLVASLITNVGVLAVFKYYDFFVQNWNVVLHFFQIPVGDVRLLKMILPIGLSFHTFQAMSYTIEVYRGHQKAEKNIGIYALYVMFYPQLVAGPIERPQNILNQFYDIHRLNWSNIWFGLRLMLWGFFKKCVIADRLSIYVNTVYNQPHSFHQGNVVLAAIFFSFQIYCDFSGYSDIALGAAKTMGFELMKNFDRPYLSTNLATFWRRWHISLSTWFRDYFYISLGGNQVSPARRYLNLFLTFMLSGLWHGANWTFVIWGAIHGFFVAATNFVKTFFAFSYKDFSVFNYIKIFIAVLFNFSLVTVAWVFFRAESLVKAIDIIKYMFGPSSTSWFEYPSVEGVTLKYSWHIFIAVLIGFLLISEEVLASNQNRFTKYSLLDSIWLGFVFFMLLTMGVFKDNSFIYFQF